MDLTPVEFDDELLTRVMAAVRPGEEILTLSNQRPNFIVAIEREGIWVQTLRSKSLGSGPQLVPAWMVETAWQHLRETGTLSNAELVDDLNVKRSAFVMALLSRFSDVVVRSTRPILVELIGGPQP